MEGAFQVPHKRPQQGLQHFHLRPAPWTYQRRQQADGRKGALRRGQLSFQQVVDDNGGPGALRQYVQRRRKILTGVLHQQAEQLIVFLKAADTGLFSGRQAMPRQVHNQHLQLLLQTEFNQGAAQAGVVVITVHQNGRSARLLWYPALYQQFIPGAGNVPGIVAHGFTEP